MRKLDFSSLAFLAVVPVASCPNAACVSDSADDVGEVTSELSGGVSVKVCRTDIDVVYASYTVEGIHYSAGASITLSAWYFPLWGVSDPITTSATVDYNGNLWIELTTQTWYLDTLHTWDPVTKSDVRLPLPTADGQCLYSDGYTPTTWTYPIGSGGGGGGGMTKPPKVIRYM